ncbi:efflux RND transporter permease subunit [Rheinheimera salexigens]|uniref:Multidrug transporter n=1 Tax=Rheinheimera salexigens TaxID=1628148 RepID=A0A1E7Q9I2_9GAMM|nr:efflux RND transporter permease subunit [Rheinheimera salexigens]OEY70839.1 multidrug transporter [Rheinheimera salexigens]
MSMFNLSALAVREKNIALFFLLLSVFGGIYAFLSLGRAEDPSFTVRAMVVSVSWPGAQPEELRLQVVDRLEKRIKEVDYLYKLDTTIRQGQASIQVEFEEYTSAEQVQDLFYQVRKRMQEEVASLPEGVIGPIVNDDFGDVYFSLIALTAPGLPLRNLTRDIEQLRDRLNRVDGVKKVILIGERTEKVFIEFAPDQLTNLGITAEAVFQAVQASNRLVPAGQLETAGPRLFIRLENSLADIEQLKNVPIQAGSELIRLSDIAQIRTGYEEPASYLVRAAGQDAMLLGVVLDPGVNGLEVGERLNSFISDEKTQLPLGFSLQVLTNQADAISSAVSLFQIKFLVAVAVVIAVSIFAIGLRAGIIVGIAVPLTLGLTFLIMLAMNINLDRITLGALIISLGLLVDDAIIAVEMMLVKIEAGWDKVRAASHAWTVTAAPMLFGTLVTVAGFLPIGFAKSGVGEYAGNIFWVLAISLIVSWIVAVFFVPYMGVKFLPAQLKQHQPTDQYQTKRYIKLRNVITWCVVHRKTVVLGTVGLLLISAFAMATLVQKQFFPSSDRPEALVSVFLPQGSSIAVTEQTVLKLEKLLKDLPQIKTYSSYIGAGAPRFFISANPEMPDPAFAKLLIVNHDAQTRDEVIAILQQAIDRGDFPEARVRVQALLFGPPVVWPIAFRILGDDPQILRNIGYQLQDIMLQHGNVVDPHLEWDERIPTLKLNLDTERLFKLGLTAEQVSQQLQFYLTGVTVTHLRQDIRTVEVVAKALIIAPPDSADGKMLQQFASRLNSVEIISASGQKMPLSQLGEMAVVYEQPVLRRYNRENMLAVQAELQGAQPNDVSMALWQQFASIRQQLPDGYRIEMGGSLQESGRGEASIQKLQPLMLATMLIFIMLQMRSFAGTFMVIATAPLGLIGAVLALLIFNQPFGFVALLGLTGLAGIIMRNTLILTQQVTDNFTAGLAAFDAVVEAAVQRARPVILTALAAVFAFIPLTTDTFWGPLAYVLIGGVAVGTVITLLFVPALYSLWFKINKA